MSKPAAKFSKPIQVRDGEVYKIPYRKDGTVVFYTVCCDCGLTHLEEYKVTKKYLRSKTWRVDELTKQQRKKKQVCRPVKP